MAETGTIMGLVGAFIGIAIMLGIGVQILGNSVQDCTALDGFTTGLLIQGALNTTEDSTGWGAACLDANSQSQSAYNLMVIILIVVAAVAILFVVRML